MSKSKKSYTDLQLEIDRLLSQQESLKGEKLDVFLNEFRKSFRSKKFQDIVVNTDNKKLRMVAKYVVDNFETLVNMESGENVHQVSKKPVVKTPVTAPYTPCNNITDIPLE